MNRENKRKIFEKGYYKTHTCHDTFTCKVCGRPCVPEYAGSNHRNHCLSSLHVDIEPGDRASDCGGIMEPIAVWVRKGGEWKGCPLCCGGFCNRRLPRIKMANGEKGLSLREMYPAERVL